MADEPQVTSQEDQVEAPAEEGDYEVIDEEQEAPKA